MVEIKDIVAVNECLFKEKNEHAIFFTFRAEVISGEIAIKNPEEISQVIWVDISTADKFMPYHKGGVRNLICNYSTYCFQGEV